MKPTFIRYINAFGMHIFTTKGVSDAKLLHMAKIAADFLDNDRDGVADDAQVVAKLRAKKAAMVIGAKSCTSPEKMERLGMYSQCLTAQETQLPGSSKFDFAIEEILHLITAGGYHFTYNADFGEHKTSPLSTLAKIMDQARGGHFTSIPKPYPSNSVHVRRQNVQLRMHGHRVLLLGTDFLDGGTAGGEWTVPEHQEGVEAVYQEAIGGQTPRFGGLVPEVQSA